MYASATHVLFDDGTVERRHRGEASAPSAPTLQFSIELVSGREGKYRLVSINAGRVAPVDSYLVSAAGIVGIDAIPRIIRWIKKNVQHVAVDKLALLLFLISTPIVDVCKLGDSSLVSVSLPEFTPSLEALPPISVNGAVFPNGAYARLFVHAASRTGSDMEDTSVYLRESQVGQAISEISALGRLPDSDVGDRLRAVRAALATYKLSVGAQLPPVVIDVPYFVSAVRIQTSDAAMNNIVVPAMLSGAPFKYAGKHDVCFIRALLHFVVESMTLDEEHRKTLTERILSIA